MKKLICPDGGIAKTIKSFCKITVLMLLTGCLLLSGQYAWAINDKTKEKEGLGSLNDLGEMVIVGREEKGAKGIAIDPTATVITVDSYTSPKAPQTVADILESIPGIDVQRGDPNMSDGKDVVKIRGLDARRIMVRLDGRPLKNVGGFSDKLIDWPSLTLEDVEKIEVVRGAHSAIFGNTLGGTINVVTKKGGHKKDNIPEGEVMVDYAKWDSQYYRMGLAGNVENFGYSLGAGHRSSNGYLRHSDYRIKDFTVRTSYEFPFKGRITLGYKGSRQDKNPFVVNDPNDPLVGQQYDSSYPIVSSDAEGWSPNYPGGDSYNDKDMDYFDVIYEQYTSIGDWKIHLYQTDEHRNYSTHMYQQAIQFYDYWCDVKFDESGLILQNKITNFNNHTITVGLEGKDQYAEYDCVNPLQEWHVDRHKMSSHYAGYIEDSWQITEKLNLALGVRWDKAELSVNMDYPGYPSHFDKEWSAWSPKSRLSYELLPETTAFLNVSKAFRLPTAMEFCWYGAPTGVFIDPETAMEYEGGIIQKLGNNNSLRVTYYYYDIDNYIMFSRYPMPLIMSGQIDKAVINADYLHLQGVEAELNFQLHRTLSGYLNYTFQEPKLGATVAPESELYDDQYQLPRHKVTLGMDWKPWENTEILATMRYVGERQTSFGKDIDSFVTFDLGVSQMFFEKTLKVKLYAMNLFDENYEEQYHIPAPERYFGINLSYMF